MPREKHDADILRAGYPAPSRAESYEILNKTATTFNRDDVLRFLNWPYSTYHIFRADIRKILRGDSGRRWTQLDLGTVIKNGQLVVYAHSREKLQWWQLEATPATSILFKFEGIFQKASQIPAFNTLLKASEAHPAGVMEKYTVDGEVEHRFMPSAMAHLAMLEHIVLMEAMKIKQDVRLRKEFTEDQINQNVPMNPAFKKKLDPTTPKKRRRLTKQPLQNCVIIAHLESQAGKFPEDMDEDHYAVIKLTTITPGSRKTDVELRDLDLKQLVVSLVAAFPDVLPSTVSYSIDDKRKVVKNNREFRDVVARLYDELPDGESTLVFQYGEVVNPPPPTQPI